VQNPARLPSSTALAKRRRRTFSKASGAGDLRVETPAERRAGRRRTTARKPRGAFGNDRCSAAGSLRRFKEVIGDIDLLASSKKPREVIEFFAAQPGCHQGHRKATPRRVVILDGGIQCDLRW